MVALYNAVLRNTVNISMLNCENHNIFKLKTRTFLVLSSLETIKKHQIPLSFLANKTDNKEPFCSIFPYICNNAYIYNKKEEKKKVTEFP